MKEFDIIASEKVFGGDRPTVHEVVKGRKTVDNGAWLDDQPAVKLIAAGPLTAQPGTLASRLVLIATDKGGRHGVGQLIVCNEVFPTYREDGETTQSHYDSGLYFSLIQLAQATEAFANRLLKNHESMASAYRVEEIIKS